MKDKLRISAILISLLSFLLYGCSNFTLAEELELDNLDGSISLTPVSASLAINQSLTFSASGGTTPYTFSVISGSGTIDPDTGVYKAPSCSCTDVIGVTDSIGESTSVPVLIYVPGSLSISPIAISIATDASLTFSAAGGIDPYTFSVFAGAGAINSTTGFYTAASTPGMVTVRVTDSDAPPSFTDSAVTVVSTPLSLVPAAITLSTNSNYFFVTTGGSPPYTYDISAGIGSIDADTGQYTSPGTSGAATVRVTDVLMATDTAAVTIVDSLLISPESVSVPVNNNLVFAAGGGTPPYTFSMESGAGLITAGGSYTAPVGAGIDEIRVTDNIGNFRIATVNVTLLQPLSISPSSFIVLTGDSATFVGSGGNLPYTFSRVSGNGAITAGGDYTASGIPGIDVIRVTDSLSATADAVVRIVDIGPLDISPATVTVEQNSTYTFAATGGAPQYNYSVVAGSGTVLSIAGEYTAPTALGTETVRVTDAALVTFDATVSVAPAAPSNLDVDGTVPGPQDIRLTWTDNATGEEGYRIERKLSGGVYAEISVTGPNVTTFTDGGLSPNIPYSYRVRAFSSGGAVLSGYSNDDFDIPNS